MGNARRLTQQDAIDLVWYCAEPAARHTLSAVQAQRYEPNHGSADPATAAAARLERLVGLHKGDVRWTRVATIMERLAPEMRTHLVELFDPQPETLDGYTRRDAGIDFTGGERSEMSGRRGPLDPYFGSEAAIVRFTPTLAERARRQLRDEHETRASFVAYQSAVASRAAPDEVVAAVHDAMSQPWAPRPDDVAARATELAHRAIAAVHAAKTAQARDAARTVLSTARREAAELQEAAEAEYVRLREELFPKKRKPRAAAPAVHWSDAAAWSDAAE